MSPPTASKIRTKAHTNYSSAGDSNNLSASMTPNSWDFVPQYMVQQRVYQMQIRSLLQHLQAPTRPDLARSNNRARQSVIRYSLATQADVVKVQNMSPQTIIDVFESAGNEWGHIKAALHQGRRLNLYLDSPEVEGHLRAQHSEIRSILQLSAGCKVLNDQYLVVATLLDLKKQELPNPDQQKLIWSKTNGVEILKAYWTHSQLVLSLGSLEDAVALCERPWVFFNGTRGIVK